MGNEKKPEMTDALQAGTKQKGAPALEKKVGKTTYIVHTFQQNQKENHKQQDKAYAQK